MGKEGRRRGEGRGKEGGMNDVNNNIWSKDSRCPKTFGQYCRLDMKDSNKCIISFHASA